MIILVKKDFPEFLSEYLTSYLPNYKNVSKNTIASYCDTFKLFLKYCRDQKGIPVEKISFKSVNQEIIFDFLEYIEKERLSCTNTRNQRLMALRSFFKYVQAESPENILLCKKVLNIPAKKHTTKSINYLTKDEIKLILKQPDVQSKHGRRDLALLSLMYDTGARVQKIIDLTPSDIRFESPEFVRLLGKGRKTRDVPLLKNTANNLHIYLKENHLLDESAKCYPVFTNRNKNKLTRFGVMYILDKYCKMAQEEDPLFKTHVTPHVLRHSKAMHMLQAGVDVIYIRDILGHVSIETTQIYAHADMSMKISALNTLGKTETPVLPIWLENKNLLEWLQNLGR